MSDPTEEEEEKKAKWHIERRINIGDFLALGMVALAVLIPGFKWGFEVEKSLTVNSAAIQAIDQRDSEQDVRITRLEDHTNQMLQRMDDKLDQILQRNTK